MPSDTRSPPRRGQLELFGTFDPRQRPLFPADPLYATGIVPTSAGQNSPKVASEPSERPSLDVDQSGAPSERPSLDVDDASSAARAAPGLAKCPDLDVARLEFVGGLWNEVIFEAEFGE